MNMGRKGRKFLVLLVALTTTLMAPAGTFAGSGESEVRAAVNQIFQDLKSRNYDALYETLPSASRTRLSRERFTSALKRAQDNYALDRIEIGRVRVAGNIAVVDTSLYGRLLKPFDAEGKIVAQQYLVREDGRWRVATGDRETTQRFLSSNPAFARQFRLQPPRIYIRKEGAWVEFTPPKRAPAN
jgi:hypothetical protein